MAADIKETMKIMRGQATVLSHILMAKYTLEILLMASKTVKAQWHISVATVIKETL